MWGAAGKDAYQNAAEAAAARKGRQNVNREREPRHVPDCNSLQPRKTHRAATLHKDALCILLPELPAHRGAALVFFWFSGCFEGSHRFHFTFFVAQHMRGFIALVWQSAFLLSAAGEETGTQRLF